MPRAKVKSKAPAKPKKRDRAKQETNSHPVLSPEVLTLAEAAAYLRVPEAEILRMAQGQLLPGRQVGNDWRFLKTALQEWLRSPQPPVSKKDFWEKQIGALRDDPYLEEMLKEIYRQRGRPEVEER